MSGKPRTTPLMLAAQNGDTDTINELLKHGANVNATDDRGWSPLIVAIFGGHVNSVKALLNHEANVFSRVWLNNGEALNSDPQTTALMLAVKRRSKPIVKLLLKHGAKVNDKGPRGWTPIHYAVSNRADTELLQLLLDKRADLTVKTDSQPPATRNNIGDIIRPGEDIEPSQTVLMLAVKNADVPTLKLLMENGAKKVLEMRNNDGQSALMIAAEIGNDEVVKELLSDGADPMATDIEGRTAVDIATKSEHKSVVALLKEAMRDIPMTNNN